MQSNLFGENTASSLSIEQAANIAKVSTATIRNWIKTGYLPLQGKGFISKAAFEVFMATVAGKEKLNARANKLQKEKDKPENNTIQAHILSQKFDGEQIGIAYENTLSEAHHNKEGVYYTPSWIVKDMLAGAEIQADSCFLDPCCGSGNFILEALRLGVAPENVYGFDIDENAVYITKERIRKEFGVETPNIKVGDYLEQTLKLRNEGQKFDLIFTNPPWGKKIDKADKERYASAFNCAGSLDTSALFLGASLTMLKKDGFLGFLIQEAFFNISAYEGIRTKVLEKEIVSLTDYGKAFKGLLTKAQAIIIANKERISVEHKIKCRYDANVFYRSKDSFKNNPKHILNFWATESDAQIIDRLYSVEHITLAERAKWALGIVTGNNEKFCHSEPLSGYIPVYKGADITKSGLKEPTNFILSDFSKMQQVAPKEMYQADEKLIYRFISSDLCFFCDDKQRFILNSANLLIPYDMGISAKQLADLLNSELLNWLFKKLFSTHKVLRGDLELLPIHASYFEKHSVFCEESYLNYLQITKSENGTFRIKG